MVLSAQDDLDTVRQACVNRVPARINRTVLQFLWGQSYNNGEGDFSPNDAEAVRWFHSLTPNRATQKAQDEAMMVPRYWSLGRFPRAGRWTAAWLKLTQGPKRWLLRKSDLGTVQSGEFPGWMPDQGDRPRPVRSPHVRQWAGCSQRGDNTEAVKSSLGWDSA